MKLSVSEILDKTSKLENYEDKINYLRENDTPAMRTILQLAYHPNVKSALPEGGPPYKPCEYLDQEGRLFTEYRKLYLFCEGGNDTIKPLKRESLFIQLLESISPKDAELIIAAKDKKIPYKGITPRLVYEAFPDTLPEEVLSLPEPIFQEDIIDNEPPVIIEEVIQPKPKRKRYPPKPRTYDKKVRLPNNANKGPKV